MRRQVLLVFAAAAFGGCASTSDFRARQDGRLAEYEAHAGAPVGRISMYTGLDSWVALAPDKLAIFLGVNRAFLLTLRAPCSGLEFQQRIGISSNTGSIDAGFDKVYFERQVCWIHEIRPIDYKAFKRERRARHDERGE